jgi:hypothetical protein
MGHPAPKVSALFNVWATRPMRLHQWGTRGIGAPFHVWATRQPIVVTRPRGTIVGSAMTSEKNESTDDVEVAEDYRGQRQARYPSSPFDRLSKTRNESAHFAELIRQMIRVSFGEDFDGDKLMESVDQDLDQTELPAHRDEPVTRTIVQSLVKRVHEAYLELGSPPIREYVFGAAPTVSLEAYNTSVPFTEMSIISVSQGLISFCSHLSKLFALSMPHRDGKVSVEVEISADATVKAVFEDKALLQLWMETLLFYALGIGPQAVPLKFIPQNRNPTRIQFLDALELFAAAHEFAHHAFQHGKCEELAVDNFIEMKAEEFEADEIAVALCRAIGLSDRNPYLMSGSGAAVLLRAMELVRLCRQILSSGQESLPVSKTHPSTKERLDRSNEWDLFVPDAHREKMCGIRSELLLILDRVWERLRPVFYTLHEEGVRPEDQASDWLP